ncbi:MAG TPA: radical SAM protein [Methanosarcinales archaeon]|nr:radical SAM protein [Methanosarcinales archaeon]
MTGNTPIKDVRYQVTHACNLKCPHCFSNSGKAMRNELSLEEAKKMILDLKDNGLKLFTLTGGEPLIRKDFTLDLVKFLSDLGIYNRVFTNGTLINRKIARELKERGVSEVQISLDGTEEVHDHWRGVQGSFKKSIKAIKFLKSADIKTAIRVTVMPFNYDQMPELLELAEELEVDGFRVKPFISVGRGKENQKYLLTPEQHETAIGYLANKRRESKINIQLLTPSYAFLYDKSIDLSKIKRKYKSYKCSCGNSLGAITPDGYLKPCGYFSEKLGNVRRDNIKEIWNCNKFVCSLRNVILNKVCMTCEYIALCGGGCRASAYENNGGSLGSIDPLCPKINAQLSLGVRSQVSGLSRQPPRRITF